MSRTPIPQREQFDALPILRKRFSLFDIAVAAHIKGGCWAEFGVKIGGSAEALMTLHTSTAPFYLFDSWKGLAEDWIEEGNIICKKGKFAGAAPPDIPGTTNVVGFFSDTLPGFKFDGPLSFVHIDCDLESSAMTVLEHVPMVPGMVVIFDEFFMSDLGFTTPVGDLFGCGECRAWVAIVESRGIKWNYLGRTTRNRVAIEIVEIRSQRIR